MDPQNQTQLIKRVATLESQIKEVLKWKKDREKQQLTLPLDYASTRVLDNAFRAVNFTEFHVRDIFFIRTESSPTVNGQMRYFNDLATQTFRGTTTEGVFTGSFNLTGV